MFKGKNNTKPFRESHLNNDGRHHVCRALWGGAGGGRGVLSYISHNIRGIHATPKGMVFASFWSGVGYALRGNYGSVWKHICRFNKEVELRIRNLSFAPECKKSKVMKKKQVFAFKAWSENGCGKWHCLVWNRVRIWRTGRPLHHQEFPQVPPRAFQAYSLFAVVAIPSQVYVQSNSAFTDHHQFLFRIVASWR